ncbi:hypothetical protein CIHG_09629 [Coccidioides immitis H538.4]|uniref:Uncharacterized protein n=1 Tax=Coccidioides immitis H538.4 TaxID=396776 RepID=A0A0J8S4M7_COCIT|nr:hypothetical protein CIHG_09629 [Coccidioides immitis H538.4]
MWRRASTPVVAEENHEGRRTIIQRDVSANARTTARTDIPNGSPEAIRASLDETQQTEHDNGEEVMSKETCITPQIIIFPITRYYFIKPRSRRPSTIEKLKAKNTFGRHAAPGTMLIGAINTPPKEDPILLWLK